MPTTQLSTSSSVTTTTATLSYPNISVFELFADRAWNDTLFFRFGKHTVKWGVGYFWSPADVINLTAIDVTDPTAQREGPISLRLLAPIKGTQSNIWAYAVVPTPAAGAALQPADTAIAAKYEFLLGNYEIGLGGFYQRDLAPKAMITATGSVWKFNLFGEGVVSRGSDKDWVDTISIANLATEKSPITTLKNKDDPYFSGTAGFAYVDSSNDVMGTFQYFYNGNGYSDSKRKDLIKQGRKAITDAGTIPANGTDLSTQMNYMLKGLISGSSQHYVGASLQKSKLLNDKLTLGVLAIANASDLSGMVQPNATFQFFDGFSMALNPTFFWSTGALWGSGDDGEYVVVAGGPSVSLSFKATLGSGNF